MADDERRPLCGDRDRYGDGLGAKSRQSGKPCRKSALIGATRCRNHSGEHQLREPGDPRRGGRPATVGTYIKNLSPAMQRDYAELADLVGGLDEELHAARAYLADAMRQHTLNPKGGITVSIGKQSGGTHVAIRAYADIIADLMDRIRKLELARSKLTESSGTDAKGAIRDLMDKINTGEFEQPPDSQDD